MKYSIVVFVAALAMAGCSRSNSPTHTSRATSPAFVEEQPHVNTGTGGIGSGPTGTGGSEPTDQSPMSR